MAHSCPLVRCSKVVSNLRYTGHQINVFRHGGRRGGDDRANNDGAASEANPLLFGRHGDAECFVEGQRNVPVEGATRIRNGSGQTVSSR
jgi:hypothetical protein